MGGRPKVIATVLLCTGLLGALAAAGYQASRTGPFELWTFRAGMAFSTIDDREQDATKRRFVCTPLEGAGRFCQLHGRALKGMVRLFVDAKGRASVIQFWPDDDDAFVGDEARRLAAEWTEVRAPLSDHPDEQRAWVTTSLWRTTDRRWSATIQFSCYPRTPTVIELADNAAIAEAIARNPAAAAQLAGAHLIAPPEEVEAYDAPRRAPGECRTPKFATPSP
jgi:hypothetical protein